MKKESVMEMKNTFVELEQFGRVNPRGIGGSEWWRGFFEDIYHWLHLLPDPR